MTKDDYQLWENYHLGLIKRELSEEEQKEIDASEFAMHLLVPTEAISQIAEYFGGLEIVLHSSTLVQMLANKFVVPTNIIIFKIDYLIKEKMKEKAEETSFERH